MPTRSIPPSPIRPPPRSPIRASFKFPVEQHLLVTTQKEVITWDQQGIKSVFQSGSRGILAAKEASDGSGLLAVADSQVVVLHDVRQALNRSYRLKATEVSFGGLMVYLGRSLTSFIGQSTTARVFERLTKHLLHDHPPKCSPDILPQELVPHRPA